MINFKPVDENVTYLLLVRHGATDANEQRPYILQGDAIDLNLSENGRRQAEAVGNFLAKYPITAVYASTMKRSIETAETIARHHSLSIEEHSELKEADVGAWEGLDWGTIMEQYPEAHARFFENPAENPYLEGESYNDVHNRAAPKINELIERHRGEAFVVVAHNVVNRSLLAPILGIDMRYAKGIAQANTGINILKNDGKETKIVTLNSFFHLEGHEF
ncbi:MAG: histidine phosphatase family protein [Planctomycetaceae bacterium]|nr:histidine phosphatase family protein [Planctomycetaceae bacterium]